MKKEVSNEVLLCVYHGDASRATLAYLALVGLKFLLRRGFGEGGFTCLGRLQFGHLRVCTADLAVNFDRILLLHSVGDMTINVECGLGANVAYHIIFL